MQVRVLRDVRQDEQLCVAYINLTEDRQTRQHQLAHAKHFNCACERCSEPIETSNDRFLEVSRHHANLLQSKSVNICNECACLNGGKVHLALRAAVLCSSAGLGLQHEHVSWTSHCTRPASS